MGPLVFDSEVLTVSVAVIVWLPMVFIVPLKTWTPASVGVKV